MLSKSAITGAVQQLLNGKYGNDEKILRMEQIHGGDINQTFQLFTNPGQFFLKLNTSITDPDFFDAEVKGLKALKGKSGLLIPQPIASGNGEGFTFLLMEFLRKGQPAKDFWTAFGTDLANQHRNSNPGFGWIDQNYIGILPQINTPADSWAAFYAQSRILPLVRLASDKNLLDSQGAGMAENLCHRLPELIPEEEPALLHGDLWNGNFLVHQNGYAAVFDPAVYFGHRETDLAMTSLFGGFNHEFYQAYHQSFPLQKGWEERASLFQLYPLLVHLILFGGHYYDSVLSVIKKFR